MHAALYVANMHERAQSRAAGGDEAEEVREGSRPMKTYQNRGKRRASREDLCVFTPLMVNRFEEDYCQREKRKGTQGEVITPMVEPTITVCGCPDRV